MKQIDIPYSEEISKDADLGEISTFLDKLDFKNIETQSWPEYSYKPAISFTIAHCGDCIFIKFNVLEKFIQAIYRQNNEPVSNDSCVEFFIALDNGNDYYNFEFNCIGTCKAGFGTKNRQDRDYLPDEIIDQINRQALIKTGKQYTDGLIAWELTVAIPVQVFCYNNIPSFKGLKGRANFYKCGDHLPEPHFIVWNEVKAAKPDFHLPEFFGKIHFL
ncbi:MAG: carbohydrate-binding family 9-like protein [Cyclobacteriaceae bacterium]